MKSLHRHGRRAFTLVELLVVIAIIALLAGLLIPALKGAVGSRDETVALNNMRQIGVAFSLYANDNSFMLPSRSAAQPSQSSPDKWPVLLSKYLGDVRVYASSFDTQNWILRSLTTAQALSNDQNNTSYIMNGYNDLGAFNSSGVQIRINQFASTANVILLGTPMIGSRQFYMDFEEAPNGNQNDALQTAAFNGGSNYLFADGSAKFITQTAYNSPSPDNNVTGSQETYGNWLWKVNKDYAIPNIGNGGH